MELKYGMYPGKWPTTSKGEQGRRRKMRHTYQDEQIDSDLLPAKHHHAFCFPSMPSVELVLITHIVQKILPRNQGYARRKIN